MKIFHLLASSQFSGAENVVCQIIDLCADKNCEMIYCSPKGPIRDALKERNVSFYALDRFTSTDIARAISIIQPNIIHAHDMRASYMASKVCGSIPVISHIHYNPYDARSISKRTLGFLWATRRISKIIWVSKSAMTDFYFSRIVKSKSILLPNVIDLEKLSKRASEAQDKTSYDVVFLGRLQYQKNPIRFVDVIRLVAKKYPNIRVAIMGDGEQRTLIEQKINEHSLQQNVTILGFISNPLGILKNAKALVMTSFWEGTPMCSLEALGLGTPVIATPVDGLKEIIVNEYNGYLSDSNDVLAEEIVKIVTESDYYERLSIASLDSALRINNKEKYRDTIFNCYQEIVSKS